MIFVELLLPSQRQAKLRDIHDKRLLDRP